MHHKISELLEKYPISDAAREAVSAHALMYIDGEFVEGGAGEPFQLVEPSTGAPLTTATRASEDDLDRAVAAARRAFESGPWATMAPNERQRILLKLADLVEEHAQTLAEIETINNGKALGPCLDMDVLGSADLIRYMAGFATKIHGETRQVSTPGEHLAMTIKAPIGVVGGIVPWNWPFNMAIWKLAAPLAAGCTYVLKPAEITPLSMLYFAKLSKEAGLPDGVLNVVTGSGRSIGSRLAGHPGVDKVSFTGSTAVGRSVGAAAGDALSPVTLELGGKSPMVAFEDADLDALAEAARWSVWFNTGQVCSAGSRVYLQRSIWERGLERLAEEARSLKVAPGLDPDCDVGPLVSQAQYDSVGRYYDIAAEEGAAVVAGGNMVEGDGFFVEPTLFATENNRCTTVQEEIFGPALVAVPFDTEEEAFRLANDNQYGLAASVWTKDVSRAMRGLKALDAGSVWVNAHDLIDSAMPFGGFKNSGFGKDVGADQLDHFLKIKTAWIAI